MLKQYFYKLHFQFQISTSASSLGFALMENVSTQTVASDAYAMLVTIYLQMQLSV